jgi:septum formation protein
MILKRKLYLASASPRRRALLEQVGLDFVIVRAPVEETLQGPLDAALSALARKKALAAQAQASDGVILAADTVVVCQGRVFGKPENERQAQQMLRALSGTVHQVKTGVCVLDGVSGRSLCTVETTDVTFEALSETQIAQYIQSGEPMDKAGAYAIQGLGAQFVRKINGCYYNVVGLPVAATLGLLRQLGALG